MTTPHRRLAALEKRYRVGPDAPAEEQFHAVGWAIRRGPDGPAYEALLRTYEARLGTHPESVSLEDFDPADAQMLTAILVRAYRVLGWPIRDDLEQEGAMP